MNTGTGFAYLRARYYDPATEALEHYAASFEATREGAQAAFKLLSAKTQALTTGEARIRGGSAFADGMNT